MRAVQETADRPLVSVTEAATLAGLSKSVAYRLAAAGVLPGLVRIPGARLLVRRRVLEAWLAGVEGLGPENATPPEHRVANLGHPSTASVNGTDDSRVMHGTSGR